MKHARHIRKDAFVCARAYGPRCALGANRNFDNVSMATYQGLLLPSYLAMPSLLKATTTRKARQIIQILKLP